MHPSTFVIVVIVWFVNAAEFDGGCLKNKSVAKNIFLGNICVHENHDLVHYYWPKKCRMVHGWRRILEPGPQHVGVGFIMVVRPAGGGAPIISHEMNPDP